MKKLITYIAVIFIISVGCEDDITVALEEGPERIVIDASIKWQKGTTGENQTIYITKTTGYYNEDVPVVNNAIVQITNSNNEVFNFFEDGNTGNYICNDFIPVLDETYTLTIIAEGNTFTASESLLPVAPIDFVTQELGGFSGEEVVIKAFYDDPANIENFYLYSFNTPMIGRPELTVFKDEFFDGNQIFAAYFEEDLVAGDLVTIEGQGISESYFNYMQILIAQTGSDSGGPFNTSPANVRGNIINTTNENNYLYGYFRLSETDVTIYEVQ